MFAQQMIIRKKITTIGFLSMIFLLTSIFTLCYHSLFAWPIVNGVAVCTATNYEYNLTLISDGSGGAILAWTDLRNDSIPDFEDIYAQKINSSGYTNWTSNGVSVSTVGYFQYNSSIISDDNGGSIITWNASPSFGTPDEIYAQRVNSIGKNLWTNNGIAICNVSTNKGIPLMVSDGAGGAIIAWNDFRPGASGIYAQRVNQNGFNYWSLNGLAISTMSTNQGMAGMVSDGVGGAIISWRDNRNGNINIYAQRINSNGSTLWSVNGLAITTVEHLIEGTLIINDGFGGAIFTWIDNWNGNYDIYTQRVNSNGSTLWLSSGIPICTATTNFGPLAIANDGSGGAIITWEDYRNSSFNTNIYAQQINANGSIYPAVSVPKETWELYR